jgi:hypothetical protein
MADESPQQPPQQVYQTSVPVQQAVSQPVYATMQQNPSVDIFGDSAASEISQKTAFAYENIVIPLVQVLSESDQSLKIKATGLSIKAAFQRVKDRMFLDMLFENKSATTYSVPSSLM